MCLVEPCLIAPYLSHLSDDDEKQMLSCPYKLYPRTSNITVRFSSTLFENHHKSSPPALSLILLFNKETLREMADRPTDRREKPDCTFCASFSYFSKQSLFHLFHHHHYEKGSIQRETCAQIDRLPYVCK